jgi:cell volume regulation protein A
MADLAFGLAGIIIILGFVGQYLFKKTGIPDILILMILGILLGPIFKIIDPGILNPISSVFVVLALIIILFDGGLNLNIHKVIEESPRAMVLAILEIIISISLTTFLTFFVLRWSFMLSLLLGLTLAGTCSSVVIPLIHRINVSDEIKTILSLESAFTDAITITLVLALIQFMTTAQAGILNVAQGIVGAFSIAIVLGIILGIFWLKIFRYISGGEYDEIITLAVVLLFYSIAESLGGNGAIFTLFFGLVLGNGIYFSSILKMKEFTQANDIMKKFHAEISFMITTFFFVYIGLILVVEKYMLFLYSLILSFVLLFGRYISTKITSRGNPILKKNLEIIRIMIPRGLATAVLSELIVMSGIPGTDNFPQIVIVVIITTVIISGVGASIIGRKTKENPRAERKVKEILESFNK